MAQRAAPLASHLLVRPFVATAGGIPSRAALERAWQEATPQPVRHAATSVLSAEEMARLWAALPPRRPLAHAEPLDATLARTAVHEAGHAIWAWRRGIPFGVVSVLPGNDPVPHWGIMHGPADAHAVGQRMANTRRAMVTEIAVSVAGLVAEQVFDGAIEWDDPGAATDRRKAVANARREVRGDRG